MYPSIPADLKLNMFPNLASLTYSYNGGAWAERPDDVPLLRDVLGYFEVSEAVPRLETIKLILTLDGGDSLNDDFWMERKDVLANDISWSSLNRMLTSGHFPRLQQLDIDLKFNNSLFEELDWEVIHDAIGNRVGRRALEAKVRTTILNHFVELQSELVVVNVKLSTDF